MAENELPEKLAQDRLVSSTISADTLVDKDSLGFSPYIDALAAFILDQESGLPVTISIEGTWGSGKSNFMHLLRQKVTPECMTVWFNAWRHQEDESMWASFALQLTDQLFAKNPILRLVQQWKMFWLRFCWTDGWRDFAKFLLYAVLVVGVALLLSGNALATSGLLALGAFVTFKNHLSSIVGNPIAPDLSRHLKAPDYAKKVSFLEQFHKDFNKLVKALVPGDTRIVVFIDDLDRAVAPRTADLIEALNLMLEGGPNIVFVLGLDREIVAAAIATKHDKSLKYLRHRIPKPAPENYYADQTEALEFGFEYLEKFIQIPFKLPQMQSWQLSDFIRSLNSGIKPNKSLMAGDSKSTTPVDRSKEQSLPGNNVKSNVVPHVLIPRQLKDDLRLGSEKMNAILEMVAPALDWNPRRLKQFINVFRLRCYIAQLTGLFGTPTSIVNARSNSQSISMEQLAKFSCLALRWPALFADAIRESRLLGEILDLRNVTGEKVSSPASKFWLDRDEVVKLIHHKTQKEKDFILSLEQCRTLLQTCPATTVLFTSDSPATVEVFQGASENNTTLPLPVEPVSAEPLSMELAFNLSGPESTTSRDKGIFHFQYSLVVSNHSKEKNGDFYFTVQFPAEFLRESPLQGKAELIDRNSEFLKFRVPTGAPLVQGNSRQMLDCTINCEWKREHDESRDSIYSLPIIYELYIQQKFQGRKRISVADLDPASVKNRGT